ncbi:DUF6415 family natural product biosynthesis protein [Streptomyces sp. NPDC088789]|uniref:DUF6415 family natural product biosynthesis protein n=1 Tax=Streptomyces sp. NPDC088789 TaxID=3365899 RepID=UPI0037FAB044
MRVKDPSVPTNPWNPSHDVGDVRRYLRAVREWAGVDWDDVYDDLDTVLHGEEEISHHAAGSSDGAPLPDYDDAEEIAQRFRGALKLLVARALRATADEKPPAIADLIGQARALRAEELPGEPSQALGLLRNLAQVTLELAERLDEADIVKGLVEC